MTKERHSWTNLTASVSLGLALHAQEGCRLPPLTTVRVPAGIEEIKLRQALLQNHNIEVGGGIGALQGQVLRIGLMGFGSTEQNVLLLLFALEKELAGLGHRLDNGAGVAAAVRYYDASS